MDGRCRVCPRTAIIDVCWGYWRSYLQFKQSETSSSSCLSVVPSGRALDNWLESVNWSWSNLRGLCETSSSSSVFSAWLIEVDSHPSLPVLVEVVVGDDVVVLDCLR